MARSKNSRGSAPSHKGTSISGDISLIQPLNGGLHAYVTTPKGFSKHVATSSEAFTSELAILDEAGYTERVSAELTALAARFPGTPFETVAAARFASV